MRKCTLVLCVTLLVLVTATASWARLWNDSKILLPNAPTFNCGPTPSLALLYGVQPVVSNCGPSTCGGSVVHQTAFGWETYAIAPGFIAGNGGRTIVSYAAPVTYGQDGSFYSVSLDPPLRPISLSGGDGPAWRFSSGPWPTVTAGPDGAVYMTMGRTVARACGGVWSQPVSLELFSTDMAVSRFGDIAVAGVYGSARAVQWFDFRYGAWRLRSLAGSGSTEKVDVEWDNLGNLGVAYTDRGSGSVKFDYLDMRSGVWTSEVVNSASSQGFLGAALAFDRFGNPVIASGQDLFYDPLPVPEPSSILALLCGLCGLAGLVHRGRFFS